MENVLQVAFTKNELRNGTVVVRLVVFETDPETGARSVQDILETDFANLAGIKWLALVVARDYPNATVTFTQNRTLEDFDTGRAQRLESRIVRAVAQLEVEPY